MGQSLSFHRCRERRQHVKYFRNLCSLARLAEVSGLVFAVCWSLVCNFHCGLERVSVKRHLRPWISGLINQHTLMNASSSCATQAFLCCRPHTMQPAGSLCWESVLQPEQTHTGVPLLLRNTPAPSSLLVTSRNRECVLQPLIYPQLTHTTGQTLHLK